MFKTYISFCAFNLILATFGTTYSCVIIQCVHEHFGPAAQAFSAFGMPYYQEIGVCKTCPYTSIQSSLVIL